MTTIPAPICVGCKHLRRGGAKMACTAFPEGIPREIIESEKDHRKPYPGDDHVRYDPKTAADAKYADLLFSDEVE